MKSIVVAVDIRSGIGAKNDLLWLRDLPTDLKHFKELTTNKTVIMGRKTFESIGRPLPKRQNIVVSQEPIEKEGVQTAASLSDAYSLAQHEVLVIGGGQLYRSAIDDVDVLYVTEVDAEFPQADVFFPIIDKNIWKEVSREAHQAGGQDKYAFSFVTYQRII